MTFLFGALFARRRSASRDPAHRLTKAVFLAAFERPALFCGRMLPGSNARWTKSSMLNTAFAAGPQIYDLEGKLLYHLGVTCTGRSSTCRAAEPSNAASGHALSFPRFP